MIAIRSFFGDPKANVDFTGWKRNQMKDELKLLHDDVKIGCYSSSFT